MSAAVTLICSDRWLDWQFVAGATLYIPICGQISATQLKVEPIHTG